MRHTREESDDAGQDSFLDVVANIVGVLVILIMLVGASATQSALQSQQKTPQQTQTQQLSARNAEPTANPNEQLQPESQTPAPQTAVAKVDTTALSEELERLNHEATQTEKLIRRSAAKTINIRLASAQHEQQRIKLAMHQSLVKQDLEQRRNKLDAETRQKYDTQQEIFAVKLELKELAKKQMALASEASDTEEIDVLPTPIARRVDGDSIHLWVKGGRVCVVPFKEMQDELFDNLSYYRRILANKGRAKATLGPTEGFRLRVTMVERIEAAAVTGPLAGQAGPKREIYPLLHWIPDSEELGFNVEQALLPNSSFLKRMQRLRKETDAIVVWLYKDSFDQFRPLKKSLYELGFLFDVRIMPLDVYIGASTHGRESYAQ